MTLGRHPVGPAARTGKRSARPAKFRPQVTRLEDRTVPSSTLPLGGAPAAVIPTGGTGDGTTAATGTTTTDAGTGTATTTTTDTSTDTSTGGAVTTSDGTTPINTGGTNTDGTVTTTTESDPPIGLPVPPVPPVPLHTPGIIAVGSDPGGDPRVRVYDAATGALKYDFLAFDVNFHGGVRVAVGDLNGDGTDDIICGAGPGGGPVVRAYDGRTGVVYQSFMAYDSHFTGGVYVAVGDVTGSGHADIVTGAGPTGGPHVEVWDGLSFAKLSQFYAYDPRFTGGVRVAAGDVDGDHHADVITGAGPGGGPHVRVYSGADHHLITQYYAYDATYTGGVYVAAGDITGTGRADVITGAGTWGATLVHVFHGTDGQKKFEFRAGDDPRSPASVRVAVADFNQDGHADVVTSVRGHLRVRDGKDMTVLSNLDVNDPSNASGLNIA
jgi:hypothetical protein